MTEIEKLFENANIKKTHKYQREIDNGDPRFTGISHSNSYIVYPDFTAEKQFKIIKLLSKIRDAIQLCYSDNQYIFVVNFETAKCQWANKYHDKPDEALADIVNVLWQDLTDQEKEGIRGILDE